MEKIIGQISVDSGEVLIADPCYLKGDVDKGARVVRHQTRSGDGMFDVIGRYDSKKRIRSLRVDFQTGTGHIIDAALENATLGEIVNAMKIYFGEWHEKSII